MWEIVDNATLKCKVCADGVLRSKKNRIRHEGTDIHIHALEVRRRREEMHQIGGVDVSQSRLAQILGLGTDPSTSTHHVPPPQPLQPPARSVSPPSMGIEIGDWPDEASTSYVLNPTSEELLARTLDRAISRLAGVDISSDDEDFEIDPPGPPVIVEEEPAGETPFVPSQSLLIPRLRRLTRYRAAGAR